MISIRKFMDGAPPAESGPLKAQDKGLLQAVLGAFGASLKAMGNASYEACPGVGDALKRKLAEAGSNLSSPMSSEQVEAAGQTIEQELSAWGKSTAGHLQQTAGEVRELLLTMARTAESVGTRDQRFAGQISEVTERLARIATLDDLSHIRTSIARSASELRGSIERMAAEGKAAVDELKKQVKTYQTKLDEAEEQASRDALTRVRNRMSVESLIEAKITAGKPFTVAMIDMDGFKKVNDKHGHQAGDELLVQFATELRSACRSTDVVGRWGGDEFVLMIESGLDESTAQVDRLRPWICGDYAVKGRDGEVKLHVEASIGLAEHRPPEPLKELMARADEAMYENKAERKRETAVESQSRPLQRAS